ncbi:MAG: aspartyl protease family protein [Candidatus Schekmanbacteria bacterium]|nr:aspartyl protease family protein [Candidatus Schekmanbacteria bacterium]
MTRALVMIASVCLGVTAARAADPHDTLERAKAASGGRAWDAIRTLYTRVSVSTAGLTGVSESWEDVQSGRHADSYRLGPVAGAGGFDGKVSWSQDTSKQVLTHGDGEDYEAAVNEAYRRSLAYWFPERWPAAVTDGGEHSEGERRFLLVRITPRGGRPFEMWFDAQSLFLDRIVEKGATNTRTTFAWDYRRVGGVMIPYAHRSTNGDTKYDQLTTTQTTELNPSIDRAKLEVPAPPPRDFELANGAAAVSLPFELVNNHIFLAVRVNGRGPFRMLFDTGGANVLTPTMASELGVATEGALQGRGVGEQSEDIGLAHVDKVEVGDLTIRDQVFYVIPLENLENVEGVGPFGLIGYEVFKRLVVRLDYERHLVTFTLPESFAYRGGGTVVPFTFKDQIPQVDGELEGLAGKFTIDTGSRASLDLHGPFVEMHNLKKKYSPKVEAVTGWGVGGGARSAVTRAGALKLGAVVVASPVTALSLQTKGAFTDTYVAGNVGAGILKRFNVTFDYGRQQIIFEPNANHDNVDTFDRAGIWINLDGAAFSVVDVTSGSPAAEAGLRPGDRITAIDGKSAVSVTLPAARLKLRSDPPGTKVKLTVQSGHETRAVELVLRDLI